MQARTIITVLDFLLAQNTPPVALWACRLRFFAPRDSARPEDLKYIINVFMNTNKIY